MQYTIVLTHYSAGSVQPIPRNIPLDAPLKQFSSPDYLNGSTVNFDCLLLFKNNENSKEELLDCIQISVQFVDSFINNFCFFDIQPYFWATEAATIQDLLDCIETAYSQVVFYKQNNKPEANTFLSSEVYLKRWVFEQFIATSYLIESLPYSVSGECNTYVITNLIVSEKQGDVFVPVENWLDYKPENPFNFYVRFEFTLRAHNGETLIVAKHIASPQQIEKMFNAYAKTPVFSLPFPITSMSEEYDIAKIFEFIQGLYYFFEGGNLVETCLKIGYSLEIIQPFNISQALSSPLLETTPFPIRLAGVRLADLEEKDYPSITFVYSDDSNLIKKHYLVLRERTEPNIFKDYIVSLFFKQKK